jgi:ferredoxin
MWVLITIQDSKWNNVWSFQAEDKKSFTKMAKEHDIIIQTACGAGACGMCKCNIIDWYDLVQRDKISQPLWELKKDKNGLITTIFTCIAGVKSKYLNDGKDYEIVLRRNI